jgi:hypothetical protein
VELSNDREIGIVDWLTRCVVVEFFSKRPPLLDYITVAVYLEPSGRHMENGSHVDAKWLPLLCSKNIAIMSPSGRRLVNIHYVLIGLKGYETT